MILRTKITNLQDRSDCFTWLNRNVGNVAPGQTVVLEGSPEKYLSNFENYQLFEKSRLAGYIKVILETDLSVHRLKQDENMKEKVMDNEKNIQPTSEDIAPSDELPTSETFTKSPERVEFRDLLRPDKGHTVPGVQEKDLFE